jgi:hypothetical protein
MALESRTADHARFACWSRRKASGWRFTGSHAAYPLHGGWKKGRRTWTRTRSVDCGPCSRPPVPPEQAPTGSGSSRCGFSVGLWSLVCDRQAPPLHRKTRASDGSRVFAALAWSIPFHLSNVNHSNSRRTSFLKFGSDVVFTPGGTSALTVLHTILPRGGRSRHSFYSHPQSVIHFVSFRSCSSSSSSSNRTPARCSQQTRRNSLALIISDLPYLPQLRHCAYYCCDQHPDHERPRFPSTDLSHHSRLVK